VCQYGKFEETFSIEHLADLKSALCPDELKKIVIEQLKDITIIKAYKMSSVKKQEFSAQLNVILN